MQLFGDRCGLVGGTALQQDLLVKRISVPRSSAGVQSARTPEPLNTAATVGGPCTVQAAGSAQPSRAWRHWPRRCRAWRRRGRACGGPGRRPRRAALRRRREDARAGPSAGAGCSSARTATAGILQGILKDQHEWAIPGQEDGRHRRPGAAGARDREIVEEAGVHQAQADECLAGTGHAGDQDQVTGAPCCGFAGDGGDAGDGRLGGGVGALDAGPLSGRPPGDVGPAGPSGEILMPGRDTAAMRRSGWGMVGLPRTLSGFAF